MTHLLALDPRHYVPHPMHSAERVWAETNCYVDLWTEVLHSLGLEPLVAGAFALATDFEGDQWTFFKHPPEDLWTAFGIDVHELNVWRPVLDHVREHLSLGHLLTVEVDARHLPDTAGVSYGIASVKTTIVPNEVDVEHRRLGYFHNGGYFTLSGTDFDGLFGLGTRAGDHPSLPPYVEVVRLERMSQPDDARAVTTASALLRRHLARRPVDNPVVRLGERLAADRAWIQQQSLETFHLWAFATVRQCGASAELAAAFCRWLGTRLGTRLGARADSRLDAGHLLLEAARHWTRLAEGAKSLQFLMARLARGRRVELEGALADMAEHWDEGQRLACAAVGG